MSAPPPALEPARIALADGVPASERYGDVYASRDGAAGQARHVFLGGNGLPARWRGRRQFVVVENGFGLGTNFLATWQAWRDDPARPARLHYVALELHPVAAADLRKFAPPELAALAGELAAAWPLLLPGLHRCRLADDGHGAVTLTLALGAAAALAPQLGAGADALYLDGFAPDRNPAMWSPPLLRALARLARPGATLATWCTARAVREPLAAAGFELELRAGFGRKRQMLVGRYAPRWTVRRHEPPAAYDGERRALVVGAGLAGAACALALAQRGWQVDVLERGSHAAAGASALPAGLLHPQLAADDSRLARLTRAGFFAARALLAQLDGARSFWRDHGVFQQASDETEADAWRALVAQQALPPSYARAVPAGEAAALLGVAPRRGGLWFETGAAVGAQAWVQAMLAAGGPRVALHAGCDVRTVARTGDGWRAQAADGRQWDAPVLVAASALDAPRLLQLAHAPLAAVRGRLTRLSAALLPALRAGITGDGYLLRAPDGGLLAGATYEPDSPATFDPDGDLRAHAGNRERLQRLLQAPPAFEPAGRFDQWRAVAPDRLPLAGVIADEAAVEAAAGADAARLRGAHPADLPRARGLFGAFALGSRGLVLAPLLAELVAAQIEGEPWPVERDLAASVDPGRFLLWRLRTGRL